MGRRGVRFPLHAMPPFLSAEGVQPMRASVLSIVLAFPAAAQTAALPAAPTTQTPSKPNPLDRIICKTEDTIGTRLGAHRVCATEREWKERQEENRTAAQAMQGVGTGCPETTAGNACP